MPLSSADYRPRDAEHAVLYRVIDEHLGAFLETARRHVDGSSLPEFASLMRGGRRIEVAAI